MTDVQAPPSGLLDRQDERLSEEQGARAALGAFTRRVRSGELGALPVVVGLLVICAVFQSLNSVFLSADNLVNLLLESSSTGVIALGIVCVLLVGQIDLSVGSVSGLSAAVVGVTFVDRHWPLAASVLLALAIGALIGLVYGVLFNRVGMPSFVATLAGLLAFLGVQLWLLGDVGSINIPFDSGLVHFAQLDFVARPFAYPLVALVPAVMFLTGWENARARRRRNLSSRSMSGLAVQAVVVLAVLEAATWYLNKSRGIGWMFVLFVLLAVVLNYALTRTRWGRSVFAVGGNVEAARRAGIDVRRVYLSVFVLCSLLAALGGVLAAARLGSANQSSGTGDVNLNAIAAAVIGGTSLFGGRGSAYSAVLGIVVIQAISSGLTLLNLSSSYRFMITGAVLALAVAVDSLARRSRASHGRA